MEDVLQQAARQHLAEDPYWLRLLHMRKGIWNSWKSDIDGPDFFLSKNGRRDPQAELEATLTAAFDSSAASEDDNRIECRYPARFVWLDEKLALRNFLPPVTCGRLEAWKEKLAPESASLVFASYYMNNPASMYGHTFLRLGRKTRKEAGPLLDYTVNYSAQTTTNNGFLFALFGLTGGFRGLFSTEPYYMKVQKYNNLESRDLWEYALAIDAQGLERLVNHLWEMGHTSISYYFLNKNCSYQLLPMLEVARPDLDLSSHFTVRAVPLDTLRSILAAPGFVTDVHFRPSHLRRMRAGRSALGPEERSLALALSKHPDDETSRRLNLISPDRRAFILETAYDALRYRSGFYREQPESVRNIEHRILTMRSEQPAVVKSEISPPFPPESAHGTGRISAGFGATRDSSFEEISYRGALHDAEADQTGYTEASQLEMVHLRFRYDNRSGKARMEEGTFVNVRSLTPWEPWVHVPSWGVKIGFGSAHDLNRDAEENLFFGARGGTGVTLPLRAMPKGLWYAMVEGDASLGGIFEDRYRLGAGFSSGVIFNPLSFWRVHFSGGYMRYGAGNIGSSNRVSLIQAFPVGKNRELRFILSRDNAYQEGLLTANVYF